MVALVHIFLTEDHMIIIADQMRQCSRSHYNVCKESKDGKLFLGPRTVNFGIRSVPQSPTATNALSDAMKFIHIRSK